MQINEWILLQQSFFLRSTGTGCPQAVRSPPWDLAKPPGCGAMHAALGVPAGARVEPEGSGGSCPPPPPCGPARTVWLLKACI